jgi:AraC-like DNA-binding protein
MAPNLGKSHAGVLKKRDTKVEGMRERLPESTRGILRADLAKERFQVVKTAPDPALAPFVEYFWVLDWDLRGLPLHRQQVITHPAVHLTFTSYLTSGRTRARIAGVVRGEFVEEIADLGRVVGAAFRPGGFRPFLGAPVSTLTDRFADVAEVFGAPGRELCGVVFGAPEPATAIDRLTVFLLGRGPEPDPAIDEVAEIVRRIAAAPGLVRVGELAGLLGMTPRRLQRLFQDYVGVGPKWVIRRYRLQEAAERAAAGELDLAGLAAELGYADQAHFTRDFTAAVGISPARYARECAPATIGR